MAERDSRKTGRTTGRKSGVESRKSLIFALVAVVAAILLIGGYILTGGNIGGSGSNDGRNNTAEGTEATGGSGGRGGEGNSSSEPGGLSFLARRDDGDALAMGDVDAPVVLINYSDYRCPFCGKFARDVEPELVRDFVEQGKLRIEWRDLPIFGDQSMLGARAGRAAAEQGKFWEFNAAVYAAAPERGHAELNEENLVEFAREAGVPDLDAFREAMNSDRFDRDIAKDAEEASLIGINSTPSFIVGDKAVVGAQPREVFIDAIESQLPGGGE